MYTVLDSKYRRALDACLKTDKSILFIGSTGLQLILKEEVPLKEFKKIVSPTSSIELYSTDSFPCATLEGIVIRKTASPGLGPLLRREKHLCSLFRKTYPTISPEYLVAMKLSRDNFTMRDRWESYALLAAIANNGKEVNYEKIRSFLKGSHPKRESVLKEWCYTLSP